MGYSNQRITKIKKDPILDLLQRAEATNVEDACVVIPAIDSLTPYPNPEQTRTWIRDNLLKGVNAIVPINTFYKLNGAETSTGAVPTETQAIQYTTIIDGLPLNTYSHKFISKVDDNTTYNYKLGVKPGLMLSNLCCPVSFEAGGGSFLRQANSQNIEIDEDLSYNCRTFTELYNGHYAYTFLQRGIYHRVAGSTHNNNDSYMLHWSPMPNSSTTYEGMLIPGTQFRNSYTNYMTICMPVDLNMKYYSYGKSKDVEFSHVDNNTNNTISTTNYNGRIVGVDWSFEFTITGNHAGSGSNWGENPTTGPNSSNGICVDGQFVYTDVLGNPCTQLVVDWCQQTIEAQFNPNNPNSSSNPIGQVATGTARTCGCFIGNNRIGECCNPVTTTGTTSGYAVARTWHVTNTDAHYETHYLRNASVVRYSPTSPNNPCYYSGHGGCSSGGRRIRGYEGNDTTLKTYYLQRATFYSVIKPTTPGLPEGRVNVYLHIIDNKAVVEAAGGYWDYACGVRDRFEIELSFEPCGSSEIGCTSKLLYENVGVTDDGDFDVDIPELSISG